MNVLSKYAAIALVAPMMAVSAHAADKSDVVERIHDATAVLHELDKVPDDSIPDAIAQKAHCVVVIPSFKKGAFLGGVQYGQGLATCFVSGKGWSAPVFVQMSGVSFGLQIGGQATDLVLVGVTNDSATELLQDHVKLGGNVSVAAGPVGRASTASTTVRANAGFLSYSRNKGVFAGIDLSGDEIHQNTKDTRAFYGGHDIPFQKILAGGVPAPASTRGFLREVTRVFGAGAR